MCDTAHSIVLMRRGVLAHMCALVRHWLPQPVMSEQLEPVFQRTCDFICDSRNCVMLFPVKTLFDQGLT